MGVEYFKLTCRGFLSCLYRGTMRECPPASSQGQVRRHVRPLLSLRTWVLVWSMEIPLLNGEQLTITVSEPWEGFSELTNVSLKDPETCVG